jgi:hypothetical protein
MTRYLSFTNLLVASLALALVAILQNDAMWTVIFVICAFVCGFLANGGD